ncbi:MAG: FHA domain-containing protein [Sulfuricella sp.]|nr:FHA domain-containing protein [Sulfuricella sp.]
MAKLILSLEGQVIREIELNKERMTIGRKAHNDVQIENLAVSGEHAAITTILNDSFLEDLDSTNGTLVNGAPVKKHVLQHGDTVEIGKFHLEYVNPQASQEAPDFERTMVLRGPIGMPPPPPGDNQPEFSKTSINKQPLQMEPPPAPAAETPHAVKPPPAPPVEARPAAIQVLSGPNVGKELDLTKSLTSLGKPGVQVAVIAKRPHGYFITHVQGTSFPVVNGKTLDNQPCPLHDHDIIELAGIKMEFFLK